MDSPDDFDMGDEPTAAPPLQVSRPTAGDAGVPEDVVGQGADSEPTRAALQPLQDVDVERAHTRNGPRRPPDTSHPRQPPASQEAEEHVIACCLLEGDNGLTLQRATDAGLTPASFYFPANRVLFEVMSGMADAGHPPSIELLVEELRARRQLEAIGGFPYLMQVTGKIPTTAHAGYFIEKVRDLAEKRQLIRDATGLVEAAYAGEDLAYLRLQAAHLTPSPRAPKQDPFSRRVRLTTPPPEPVTRLFLANKPVATPGNLQTLISRAKTGKTAALGGAVAAILSAHHDNPAADCLGFSAPHTDEAVVLIDTEQSPYDAWTCHQRTIARAGSPDPDWLLHHALVGYSCADLRQALPLILEAAKTAHSGIFTVILDGVADFVPSVNDEVACNEFISWLRSLAITYNTPIMCVIHSNEGVKNGDDGRGWLGKELTRKAESNLLLKKEGEVTTITSEKQRKAPITEQDGVAFEWSEEQQRHVSCKPPVQVKGGRPAAYDFTDFESIFPRSEAKAMTKQALLRFAEDIAPVKETTFRTILADACSTGQLIRVPRPHGFVYHLPEV